MKVYVCGYACQHVHMHTRMRAPPYVSEIYNCCHIDPQMWGGPHASPKTVPNRSSLYSFLVRFRTGGKPRETDEVCRGANIGRSTMRVRATACVHVHVCMHLCAHIGAHKSQYGQRCICMRTWMQECLPLQQCVNHSRHIRILSSPISPTDPAPPTQQHHHRQVWI